VKAGPLEAATEALGSFDDLLPMLDWGWDEVAAGRLEAKTLRNAFAGEAGMWGSLHEAWLKRRRTKAKMPEADAKVLELMAKHNLLREQAERWVKEHG